MSNQDRLLSDDELHKELERILSGGIHAKGSDKGGHPTYFTKPYYLWIEDRINVALYLINTQKRLYAESVIGKDEVWEENKDGILEGIELERVWAKNKLRADQRARIK